MKSTQTAIVQVGKPGITSSYDTGVTRVLDREYSARFETFSAEQVIGEDTTTVRLSGAPGSKFFPADIEYDFSVTFDNATGAYSLSGMHDGYPSYSVYVDQKLVYDRRQGEVWELFGPADIKVQR